MTWGQRDCRFSLTLPLVYCDCRRWQDNRDMFKSIKQCSFSKPPPFLDIHASLFSALSITSTQMGIPSWVQCIPDLLYSKCIGVPRGHLAKRLFYRPVDIKMSFWQWRILLLWDWTKENKQEHTEGVYIVLDNNHYQFLNDETPHCREVIQCLSGTKTILMLLKKNFDQMIHIALIIVIDHL